MKSIKVVLVVAAVGLVALLGACAPQGNQEDVDGASSASGDFTWSVDSNCATCHEADYESFEDSSCVASFHASMQGDCMTCHDDVSGLEEAHAKVTYDSTKSKATLKKTEVSEEVCITCHDKKELVEKTAASTVLTDKNGTVVNPHAVPENEGHAKAGISCASCHKVHTEEDSVEVAPGVCKNCHHQDVYECGTCHA